MSRWIRVAELVDCPAGTAREITVEERIVAIYHVDETFYALDGICPHQGGPLGKGCLTGTIVTCPWHGWQFDVRTGQHQLSAGLRQRQYPTRVDDDGVWIDLDAGSG